MDERLRFIARLLEGEPMAAVCREFNISRVTGYKIFNRHKRNADLMRCMIEAVVPTVRRTGCRIRSNAAFSVSRTNIRPGAPRRSATS